MALYLCRWENGDFSEVQASGKEQAIEKLDEVANAEGLPLHPLANFMVHFRLTDNGRVELEDFGEEFEFYLRERVHPALGKLNVSPYDATLEDEPRIKAAVELERNRLKAEPCPEPDTELGKGLKAQTDLPTSTVNRYMRKSAKAVLRKAKPKGKPN